MKNERFICFSAVYYTMYLNPRQTKGDFLAKLAQGNPSKYKRYIRYLASKDQRLTAGSAYEQMRFEDNQAEIRRVLGPDADDGDVAVLADIWTFYENRCKSKGIDIHNPHYHYSLHSLPRREDFLEEIGIKTIGDFARICLSSAEHNRVSKKDTAEGELENKILNCGPHTRFLGWMKTGVAKRIVDKKGLSKYLRGSGRTFFGDVGGLIDQNGPEFYVSNFKRMENERITNRAEAENFFMPILREVYRSGSPEEFEKNLLVIFTYHFTRIDCFIDSVTFSKSQILKALEQYDETITESVMACLKSIIGGYDEKVCYSVNKWIELVDASDSSSKEIISWLVPILVDSALDQLPYPQIRQELKKIEFDEENPFGPEGVRLALYLMDLARRRKGQLERETQGLILEGL